MRLLWPLGGGDPCDPVLVLTTSIPRIMGAIGADTRPPTCRYITCTWHTKKYSTVGQAASQSKGHCIQIERFCHSQVPTDLSLQK